MQGSVHTVKIRRRARGERFRGQSEIGECTGKVSFDCHGTAYAVAKRRRGRSAYRCSYCRLWHVGTLKPWKG